jgi:hypothetical protein
VVRFPVTATSLAATTWSDGVSTTSPFLTLTPLALVGPMPVSSAGKDATANVEVVLLVPGGWMSKLSNWPGALMRTKFVPGTDARVI